MENHKNQELDEQIRDEMKKILKTGPEILKKVFDLFEIKKRKNDERSVEQIMREVYLDFYSKTLVNMLKN